MVPDFKLEAKPMLTWISSDNLLYYVTKNGIFRASINQPGDAVETVLETKQPVLSAWCSGGLSGRLSLLTRESITTVDPRNMRPLQEYQIEDCCTSGDAWICEVPGVWVHKIIGQQAVENLHIVYFKGEVSIVNITVKRTWKMKSLALSRGQFLVKFISNMVPSAVISTYSQLTALLPKSLKCSFLQSSIEDIVWSTESLFILTTKKDVWRITRDPETVSKCLLSHCSSMCLNDDILTILTIDGAVYRLQNNESLLNQSKMLSIRKGENIYKNIQTHSEYLETVGNLADSLEAKIAQVQCYQLLSRTPTGSIEKMLDFSVVVNAELKVLYCTLKTISPKLQLYGSYWNLQIRVICNGSERKVLTSTTTLPGVLSDCSEPIQVKVTIPENCTTMPSRVEAFLIFNVNMVKLEDTKLFPQIPLKSQEIEMLDLIEIKTNVSAVRGTNEEITFKDVIGLPRSAIREIITVPFESIGKSVKLESILNQSIHKVTVISYNFIDLRIKSDLSKKTQQLSVVLESNNREFLKAIKSKVLDL